LGCGALMVNHYSMGKSVNGLGALKTRLLGAFHWALLVKCKNWEVLDKTASPLLEMVTGAIAVPEVALTWLVLMVMSGSSTTLKAFKETDMMATARLLGAFHWALLVKCKNWEVLDKIVFKC
jgi:hypothetical protein